MVAGQNPQAAGVYGQALDEPELEREVAHHQRRPGVEEGRHAVAMLADRRARGVQSRRNLRPFDGGRHAFVAEAVQERDRVLSGLPPELGVEHLEEASDSWLPGPGQIKGKVLEVSRHGTTMLGACGPWSWRAGRAPGCGR